MMIYNAGPREKRLIGVWSFQAARSCKNRKIPMGRYAVPVGGSPAKWQEIRLMLFRALAAALFPIRQVLV